MKLTLIVAGLALCFVPVASADIVSTFDANLDGWTQIGGSPSHVASGGNPGGYYRHQDSLSSPDMTVFAPAKFLGNLSDLDGETLSFDTILLVTGGGASTATTGVVTVSSGALSATADLIAGNHSASWTTYSATLDAATWGVSQATWTSILSNVTGISVVLESEIGITEGVGFDNFRLTRFVPEPSSMLLLGLGLLGVSLRQRRARKKI